jgi:hypothetical protein
MILTVYTFADHCLGLGNRINNDKAETEKKPTEFGDCSVEAKTP